MNTNQELADLQAIVDALATGSRVDEQTYQRVRDRGEKIRNEMREKFGTRQIAVELIRDVRDEK